MTTVLPTAQVALEATILPFPAPPLPVDEVLALLDRFRAQIVAGELSPRHLIMCVVEATSPSREKSYVLSTAMTRMELIGNLFAAATEITVEPS